MKSSGKGIIAIDLGAFTTKATVLGEDWVGNVLEVPTEGFEGYVTNMRKLMQTLHTTLENIFKAFSLDTSGEVPVVVAVHLKSYFKTTMHEISIPPDNGKRVQQDHIEKLHRELQDKIIGGERSGILYFGISRYSIMQDGQALETEDPWGIRGDILRGEAAAVLAKPKLYQNLIDVFGDYNESPEGYNIELLGIYSSPVYSALGIRSFNIGDIHFHIDFGHTSFRIMKLNKSRLESYYEHPFGGYHIVQKMISMLSLPSKDAFFVLREYLKTGKQEIPVSGRKIDTTIVENILKNAIISFLKRPEVLKMTAGDGYQPYTLSISGGLSYYRRIVGYLNDANFPAPIMPKDLNPQRLVFYGLQDVIRERVVGMKEKRNGSKRLGGGLKEKVVKFIKKELLGME